MLFLCTGYVSVPEIRQCSPAAGCRSGAGVVGAELLAIWTLPTTPKANGNKGNLYLNNTMDFCFV